MVVRVTTPPLIRFLLDAGLGAFPIWSSVAVVSGLAAAAAVAAGATVCLPWSDEFERNRYVHGVRDAACSVATPVRRSYTLC